VRAAALERLARALEARSEEAARLVTVEMGMPISHSRQHNATAPCAILRYYANLARGLDTVESRTAVSFPGRTVVRREPAGVAAVIVSWNYPIMLAFSQLAPALAAGCTIVLKPAAATSLSAYILAEAFEAAGFPPGVFNLVTGTSETAALLAGHPGVDTVASLAASPPRSCWTTLTWGKPPPNSARCASGTPGRHASRCHASSCRRSGTPRHSTR
jgi:aldehyde dehydrogenase (NAD+)/betaine-aldehyde dehydrogenase